MLIELPKHAEIFGCVKIHEIQKVLKFESEAFESPLLRGITKDEMEEILHKMVVVVPIKDEKLHLLDGVLRSIPIGCDVIVVSNSQRDVNDVFRMEKDIISNFHRVTKHPVTIIHQKDPGLGMAFKEAGYTSILDDTGFVRDGKAEGMIIGLSLAKNTGKEFVCFVDADNYIPCSVNEYIKLYATGFIISQSPYAMVRLHWKYKPKVMEDRLYFKKWGRVSEITNRFLNMLISVHTGFETNIIKTGNAGEHGMTMKLAEIMAHSTGYSVEPYQLVYLLEEFWKGEPKFKDAVNSGIEVYQIETMNPHVHEDKGDVHIREMLLGSLSTIYYSRLANDGLKKEIVEELKKNEMIKKDKELRKNRILPPIKDMNIEKFVEILLNHSETLTMLSH
ncbi:MAG: mannosyl-3-phosphoglycerate synthase [Archaeoglobus sp.]|nr:MAG: mannosyl-3-phosphoglycerate synthase [Archaeoglobus sp.]